MELVGPEDVVHFEKGWKVCFHMIDGELKYHELEPDEECPIHGPATGSHGVVTRIDRDAGVLTVTASREKP